MGKGCATTVFGRNRTTLWACFQILRLIPSWTRFQCAALSVNEELPVAYIFPTGFCRLNQEVWQPWVPKIPWWNQLGTPLSAIDPGETQAAASYVNRFGRTLRCSLASLCVTKEIKESGWWLFSLWKIFENRVWIASPWTWNLRVQGFYLFWSKVFGDWKIANRLSEKGRRWHCNPVWCTRFFSNCFIQSILSFGSRWQSTPNMLPRIWPHRSPPTFWVVN